MPQAARRETAHGVAPGQAPEPATAEGTWPHALSHEPLLRVSDVLSLVQREFPTLTTSKLRFLDSHGLVCPERTPAGYRLYSHADAERLRYVLRQQRDHYRPLTVIKEHLEGLDAGRIHEPVTLRKVGEEQEDFLTGSAVAARAGIAPELLRELEGAGLVSATVPDGYEPAVLDVVVAAKAYLTAGGDVRALRTLLLAASREADRAEQAAAPLVRRDGDAADGARHEFAESAIAVFSAIVRHRVGG